MQNDSISEIIDFHASGILKLQRHSVNSSDWNYVAQNSNQALTFIIHLIRFIVLYTIAQILRCILYKIVTQQTNCIFLDIYHTLCNKLLTL